VRGADDATLGADLGELLVSTTLLVGVDRAVGSAARVIPADQLALALPYLQTRALSGDTQGKLKQRPELLDQLRDALEAATGVEHYELAELQRVTVWGLLMVLGTGVMIAFLLAVAANLGDIVDAFGEADWSWLFVVLVLAALGYPAGALSLMGAVPQRLPFVLTSEIMLAQSFLNRFTPANAGGMALRVRYVQGQGVELTNAAAAVGITSGASGVMQVVMLVGFFIWAGRTDELDFSLPDVNIVALVVVAVGVAAAVVWLTPWGRRVVKPWLYTSVGKVWTQLRAVGTSPSKVVMLFGGAGLGKLVTILAFWASIRAFGFDFPIAQVAVMYLIANTVASAVPTPGGVGAIEAALIAGLTGIDVGSAEAFSIVIIFRLITYWLPVPFGYLAYGRVQRIKAV
jgi:undecaprenyl-diphosphatase